MEGYLTLNSDASYDQVNKTGGYAFWMVCDAYVVKGYGKFKNPVGDPNECELMGVINALHWLHQRNISFNTLVVNCDNKVVRNALNGYVVNHRFDSLVGKLRKLMFDHKQIYAKIIKGHTDGKCPRDIVNNWCDEMCRAYKNGIPNKIIVEMKRPIKK